MFRTSLNHLNRSLSHESFSGFRSGHAQFFPLEGLVQVVVPIPPEMYVQVITTWEPKTSSPCGQCSFSRGVSSSPTTWPLPLSAASFSKEASSSLSCPPMAAFSSIWSSHLVFICGCHLIPSAFCCWPPPQLQRGLSTFYRALRLAISSVFALCSYKTTTYCFWNNL